MYFKSDNGYSLDMTCCLNFICVILMFVYCIFYLTTSFVKEMPIYMSLIFIDISFFSTLECVALRRALGLFRISYFTSLELNCILGCGEWSPGVL